jgi:uncharacterized membrane protein YfcA
MTRLHAALTGVITFSVILAVLILATGGPIGVPLLVIAALGALLTVFLGSVLTNRAASRKNP